MLQLEIIEVGDGVECLVTEIEDLLVVVDIMRQP